MCSLYVDPQQWGNSVGTWALREYAPFHCGWNMRPLNCFAPYSDAPLRAPCSVRFGRSGAAPLRCSVLRCSAPNLRAGAPCRSGATPLRCSALRCSVPERPCRSSATPLRCSVAPLLRCTERSCIAAERSLRDQLHRSPSTRQRRSGATAQQRICAPWHLNKSGTAQRRNGAAHVRVA